MSFDPARLYSGLLRTGLQTKDNSLYQVIHSLIGSVASLNTSNNSIISGGGGIGPTGPQGQAGMPGFVSDDNVESDFFRPNPSIQDLISNFTPGSVLFIGPSGFPAQDNPNFFWDATNKTLNIKNPTGPPAHNASLIVRGTGANCAWFESDPATQTINLFFKNSFDGYIWQFGGGQNIADDFGIFDTTQSKLPLQILGGASSGQIILNQHIALFGSANGQLKLSPQATLTTGIGLDFASPDTLRIRNFAFGAGTGVLDVGADIFSNTLTVTTVAKAATGLFGGATGGLGGLVALGSSDYQSIGATVNLFISPSRTANAGSFFDRWIIGAGQVAINDFGISNSDRSIVPLWILGGAGGGQINILKNFAKYQNISTTGWGVPALYGLDNRTGLTGVDGAAITLYTVIAANNIFRVWADIFATAAVTGTATYTIAWTENGTAQSIVVTATAINTLATNNAIIRPDNGTTITAKLTGVFTGTFTVVGLVEQVA